MNNEDYPNQYEFMQQMSDSTMKLQRDELLQALREAINKLENHCDVITLEEQKFIANALSIINKYETNTH